MKRKERVCEQATLALQTARLSRTLGWLVVTSAEGDVKIVSSITFYRLFSLDFNFANLESKYFAGLKFHDFEESPVFKVIKFRESSTLVLVF